MLSNATNKILLLHFPSCGFGCISAADSSKCWGFIFTGKNFGLSLAGLVQEEITKWEWCCLSLWCRYKYITRVRQWGIMCVYCKAGIVHFLLSVGVFQPTSIQLHIFLMWVWAHGCIFQCVQCPILWHLSIRIFSWTSVTSSLKIVKGTNNQWENTCHPSGKLLRSLIFFYLIFCAFMKCICSYSVSQTRWGGRKEIFPSLYNIVFFFIQNVDLFVIFFFKKINFSEEIFLTSITVQGLG